MVKQAITVLTTLSLAAPAFAQKTPAPAPAPTTAPVVT